LNLLIASYYFPRFIIGSNSNNQFYSHRGTKPQRKEIIFAP